ncbi:MAG: DUF2141 domain-containing protein [Pseudomonadota bacterium]
MTRFATTFAALFATAFCTNAALAGAPLTLTVTPLSAQSGELRIALYDAASTWLTETPLDAMAVPLDGATRVTFPDVEPGSYAVAIFLDQNGNAVLDTSLTRIPSEPYGFSNDSAGAFGPASWAAASFFHDGPSSHSISLGHWPAIAAR